MRISWRGRRRSDYLEYHALRAGAVVPGEVGFHRHAGEHLAQPLGGPMQVGNLPIPQVDLLRPDRQLLVPGAVLVGDGHDTMRAVGCDQPLDTAAEEVEAVSY